jgi:hypothetical protein
MTATTEYTLLTAINENLKTSLLRSILNNEYNNMRLRQVFRKTIPSGGISAKRGLPSLKRCSFIPTYVLRQSNEFKAASKNPHFFIASTLPDDNLG